MYILGNMQFSRRPQSSGFTLVELLVVIGIIAVLVSILLPALNHASEQASAIKFTSNLRQFGIADAEYAVRPDSKLLPSAQCARTIIGVLLCMNVEGFDIGSASHLTTRAPNGDIVGNDKLWKANL